MHFRTPAIVLAALLAHSALAVDCAAGKYWKQNSNGSYSCTTCATGYISKAKNVYACEPCPAGQEDTSSHTQCTNCPAGEFSPGGAACTACPNGTVSGSPGASICTNCPAGQENKNDRKSCQNCPAGEYSTGGTACQACPNGTYSINSGSSTCTNCPAGQESKSDRKSCQKCDPGEFNPTAGQACQKCPAGTFNSVQGAKSCCDCCAGYFTGSTGSTSCNKCRDYSSTKKYGPVAATSFGQCSSNIALYGNYPDTCNQAADNACPATTPNGPVGSPITRKRDMACTKGFTSCPRYSGRGGFDCVDTQNDPEACGGCVGLDGSGSGTDCTAIHGTSVTRCVKGSCVIDSCRKGWVKSLDGTECVLASRATGSPASDGLHAQDAKKRSSAKRAIRHNIF